MRSLIVLLNWFADFLEKRFPEKKDPATFATKNDVSAITDCIEVVLKAHKESIDKLLAEHEKFKQQIEILNLRVGLSRPMQTVLRTKSNG